MIEFFNIYAGEVAAVMTAFCWAISATAFEYGARRIGSLNINLIRLVFGLTFLTVFTAFTRGVIYPFDAGASAWLWLSLSGVMGLVVGDLLLFEAFVRIGSRTSMLIYSATPVFSGIMASVFLGENMSWIQIAGMFITLAGISSVILESGGGNKMKFSHPVAGVMFAAGGAIGQSAGYILGKFGMGDFNPFAAAQIRLTAGLAGFIILFAIRNHWPKLRDSLRGGKILIPIAVGSFFGPFIGVSLSLFAVQRINPGVAATLASIVPVLLLIYAFITKKEKIKFKEVLGTAIAIFGVGVMFIK